MKQSWEQIAAVVNRTICRFQPLSTRDPVTDIFDEALGQALQHAILLMFTFRVPYEDPDAVILREAYIQYSNTGIIGHDAENDNG